MGGTGITPLKIGPHSIWPPLILAPMAGATDSPLRLIAKRLGVGLVVTELTSSHALYHKNPKSMRFLRWTEEERPISAQIFGGDPAIMANAARIVAEAGADIIDINMGCWVPKVAKTGAGACLLKDVKRAAAVMEAVVKAAGVPVTVKTRVGWDGCNANVTEVAQVAEDVGVVAIAIHGRTAEQGFTGEADWVPIAATKAAVSIPVIGNGDVRTPQDAERMLRETGCDAVMIGRAALGNPWIFRQVAHYLFTGEEMAPVVPEERLALARDHARLILREEHGPDVECVAATRMPHYARGQLVHYLKDLPGSADARKRLSAAETFGDVMHLIDELEQSVHNAPDWLPAPVRQLAYA